MIHQTHQSHGIGLLERDELPSRQAGRALHQPRPHRSLVRRIVPRPQGRLGSRQVVSVRGRRVTHGRVTARRISRVGVISTLLLLCGVAIAMVLSTAAAQQTFQIQDLSAQATQLGNQIETLNRDLESSRSTANLTRTADSSGMVVPEQPGIIGVGEAGVELWREPGAETRRIVDINGSGPVKAHAPSSDPRSTAEIGGTLERRPEIPAPAAPAPAPRGSATPPYLD